MIRARWARYAPLAVTAAVSALAERYGSGLPNTVMLVLEFVFAFAVVTFLFAAMFKILPDARIEWRDVWVGAVATALDYSPSAVSQQLAVLRQKRLVMRLHLGRRTELDVLERWPPLGPP